jgi:hypothetical protein
MCLLFYYLYPFYIDKTSNPYSYSNNMRFAFVLDNICIRIRIHFKIWKWILKKHYPIWSPKGGGGVDSKLALQKAAQRVVAKSSPSMGKPRTSLHQRLALLPPKYAGLPPLVCVCFSREGIQSSRHVGGCVQEVIASQRNCIVHFGFVIKFTRKP